ncbi:putative vam6/Vps39-like protein isoform X1 [Apostichopus japonicus]|uniref:Putative vam6/Vps39-like protein isoform X1 n=1 Tax=Stichopus japonicus TaxID=307972 RepID=A0A2G8JM69_STIJA|nr:putative vam6/Vps39-like protein isoform X1 [Apostichopus japonicus]
MHIAYEARAVLPNLPLQIEAIACHGNHVLVGTKDSKDGSAKLLDYTIKRGEGIAEYEIDVNKSLKSFSKKPVQQLTCVPEHQILISLSDGLIHVHEMSHFTELFTMHKTRGASIFATDVHKTSSASGLVTYHLKMCVAVRRKIILYDWRNRSFMEITELGVSDVPRSMAWCGHSICVGFKRDYFLIGIQTGELKELFTTGNTSQVEPTITKLSEDLMALGRDNMSIIIDSEGEPAKKYALRWSDVPTVLEHDQPYVIAVMPKYIEIRTVDPRLLVQSIEIKDPKYITSGSGHVYVASQECIWKLEPVPIHNQIKELLKDKQFELALHLANMTEEVEADKQMRIQNIQNLYAFELFQQERFEESMKLFAKLSTDPAQVIGLFPDLLPGDYRNKIEYPSTPTELMGAKLEKGLTALIEYLTQKRQDLLSKDPTADMSQPSSIVEGSTTTSSSKQRAQIIDTTLLKCYLQRYLKSVKFYYFFLFRPRCFSCLPVRLKDNKCHFEESERVLKKHQKYSELIILYNKKEKHKEALDLLLRQSQKVSSPLRGHERTVQYLQKLGAKQADLIFEFATWVLSAHPEDGLKIFTEDNQEIDTLDRRKVLDYLSRAAPKLVIPYLEHIILNCGDETEAFHNQLIQMYREEIEKLMPEFEKTLPEGQSFTRAGSEPGELGALKKKLLGFLETSVNYAPKKLLAFFPKNAFFEERALLSGRAGRHEQALAIYAHLLKSANLAEAYCERHYNPTCEDSKEAFECLPGDIKVDHVHKFLGKVLEIKAKQRRAAQVSKSLFYAENLQLHPKSSQEN